MVKLLLNIITVILGIRGIYGILAGTEKGELLQHGIHALKYFTVLSNLLAILTAGCNVIFMLACGTETEFPLWLAEVDFMAAVSVTLTFLTVMLYLGRLYGYAEMLKGPNFELHLTCPVCMVLCFMLGINLPALTMRSTFLAVLPMILYGIWYMSNILIHGVIPGKNTNDFYGFARGGRKTLPFVFVLMLVFTWLIAAGLWAVRF